MTRNLKNVRNVCFVVVIVCFFRLFVVVVVFGEGGGGGGVSFLEYIHVGEDESYFLFDTMEMSG